jgi:hypothetical protein
MSVATMTKERPILFSAPMVGAILDRRKSQTRRIMKPQYDGQRLLGPEWYEPAIEGKDGELRDGKPIFGVYDEHGEFSAKCPYGAPGDHLIVKESTWMWCERRPNGITPTGKPKWHYVPMENAVPIYAEEHPHKPALTVASPRTGNQWGWRLKIGRFVPRWASRITLEITNVRIEQLNAISKSDARREGIERVGFSDSAIEEPGGVEFVDVGCWKNYADDKHPFGGILPERSFQSLWESINGKGSWSMNPWVWVIEFKSVEK